ncbi:MAG TPA: hypothetical protein VEA60_06765 [Allosphingosinicella sp.]|nr:hypothetical protein [Allosphingosinicella sp.]
MRLVGIAAAAALLAAGAAPAAAARKSEAKADPNREICKSKPVVGSRLKRIRECHTAAEWEDLKLQEQVGLMRKQINGDPGCNGGGPCGVERGGKDTPW